jgi:DNA polymerase-3 subunit epsilon
VLTWADNGMIGFDLETTGTDPKTARIVTASIVEVYPHKPVATREWLANPGIEIPAEAAAVHGITTDHARAHGQPHDDVLYEVIENLAVYVDLGLPLVVFNSPYDLTLVDWRAADAGDVPSLAQATGGPGVMYVVDPLVLDKQVSPRRRGKGVRRLAYLCQEVYEVDLSDQDAHKSGADALAACRVAWKIARRHPGLGSLPLPGLQAAQAEWYRGQQRELKAYFATQGRGGDFDGTWPYTPAPAPAPTPAPAPAPAEEGALFDQPPAPQRPGLL